MRRSSFAAGALLTTIKQKRRCGNEVVQVLKCRSQIWISVHRRSGNQNHPYELDVKHLEDAIERD